VIIRGVPSSDNYQCEWKFLVTLEDFRKLEGREPEEYDIHRSPVEEFKYMVGLGSLIKAEPGKPTTLCVEWDITIPFAAEE